MAWTLLATLEARHADAHLLWRRYMNSPFAGWAAKMHLVTISSDVPRSCVGVITLLMRLLQKRMTAIWLAYNFEFSLGPGRVVVKSSPEHRGIDSDQ